MAQILFKAIPYSKEDVTLALESGVDAVIVPAKEARKRKTRQPILRLRKRALPPLPLAGKSSLSKTSWPRAMRSMPR